MGGAITKAGLAWGLGSLCLSPLAFAQDGTEAAKPDAAPWSMADAYWGAQKMAEARDAVLAANGDQKTSLVMADRLELRFSDDEDALVWDVQGWYGGDINKLFIKTEGEMSLEESDVEDAEIQALWSRAIAPFWDLQAGIRYDLEPKGRTHAVLGFQGLAPYWFEIDGAAFLSTDGDFSARVEAEYDLRLTQRLVIQPRIELELSAQDIPALDIGSGFTGMDAGLRLRYEIKREFAPYLGVQWHGRFGNTKDLVEAKGEDASSIGLVAGLRTWF